MSVPVWPSDLPQYVLVDGFQSGPRGNRLRTAMDTGPGKMRRRGAKTKPVSCSITMEPDDLARFYRFYEDDTLNGTLPFLFPDHQFDGLALADESGVPLLTETDVPLLIESWWLVQFGENEPADTYTDGLIARVEFDLLVLP
ncbi:hypothetical protein [Mesorhizobium sp.]|uniref:hypothetical protein n=1 Tax=Mesorhizobium sp. TaxID=1871066 RepID=UPI0025F24F45|nr:hypothetical protein [Mesorhizobium sp.]